MSTLGSLMGVYAAIDEIVLADRPGKLDTAARYLPVFTDERGGPGWSRQILAFAQREWIDDESTVLSYPALEASLNDLVDADLTPSEVGRLIFATGVLLHLDPDGELVSREVLGAVLTSTTLDTDRGKAAKLLDLLSSDEYFSSRDAWDSMIRRAVDEGLLDSTMLSVTAPCNGGYVDFGGLVVTRLTTHFTTDQVTMDEVKAVLDPLNWSHCCKYFCSMTPLPPKGAWRQLLEEFSFECDWGSIKTGLKYWNRDLLGGGASVTYDLADPRPDDDDNLTLVDNGSIIVRPTVDAAGTPILEVWTSKNVLFEGLGGGGAAMWACISGWADVGRDLLFGCAQLKKGKVPWQASSDVGASPGQGSAASGSPKKAMKKANAGPGLPIDANTLVDDMVHWVTACIDDMSTRTGQCAEKAASGELTNDDVSRSTAEMASRVITDPYRLLRMAARSRSKVPSDAPAPDPAGYEGPTR